MCVCVCVSHPGLLTGRVSFGVAENEPDVFAELNGRLVLSFFERFEDGAEVYWRVNDLKVVLRTKERSLDISITGLKDENQISRGEEAGERN